MSLFVCSYLYQIIQLGDDDEEPEFSSSEQLEEEDTFFFVPRKLKNLTLVDEMDSLSPITACHIADLANEDTPQLYVTCGRGSRSTLRILRHGLEVIIKHSDERSIICMNTDHCLGNRNGCIRIARQSQCCMDSETTS
jgi:hypothetical protein